MQFNYAAPMYVAAGLAAVNFFFVWFFLPESRHPGTVTERSGIFPGLLQHVDARTFFWTLGGYFLVIVGFSIMTALFALLLFHRFGLSALHTGYILAGIGLIGVVIQGVLIGRLARRFGEPALAFAGSLLMAAGLVGLAWSPSVSWMLVAAAVTGMGNSLLMPSLSALASRSAAANWQGRALGVMQSSGSLARWAGPLLGGVLLSMQPSGETRFYAALPLGVAALFLIAAAGMVCVLRRGPEPVSR